MRSWWTTARAPPRILLSVTLRWRPPGRGTSPTGLAARSSASSTAPRSKASAPPSWPLAEMLEQECQISQSDSPAVVAEKLAAAVDRVCAPLLGPEDSRAVTAGLGVLLALESAERRVSLPDPREGDDAGSASTTL